jgi:hypothetical protein
MNPITALLSVIVGINASYEVGRNIRRTNESRRRRAFERGDRAKIRTVARKLERLGGRNAKVRSGLDDDGDFALVIIRWRALTPPPIDFMGYPVQASLSRTSPAPEEV